MQERDTRRPRGFGFVTFSDRRAMEDAIHEMHNQKLDGRTISVNRAEPKMVSDDRGYGGGGSYSAGGRDGYRGSGGGGYSAGGRGGYRGSSGRDVSGNSDCFKCGRPGHWARECPSGDESKFYLRSRFGGDHFGGGDRSGDRYMDDRYDGGSYGDRYPVHSKDRYISSGRDRYSRDRYPNSGGSDRYGGSLDRYTHNGYGKERSYGRDGGLGAGGSDRYGGGGPAGYEGRGSYGEWPGPYDRPSKGRARPSVYDHRY